MAKRIKRRAYAALFFAAACVAAALALSVVLLQYKTAAPPRPVTAAPDTGIRQTPKPLPPEAPPEKKTPPAEKSPVPQQRSPAAYHVPDTGPVVRPPETQRPQTEHTGILIFVIDDAGHNLWQLKAFLDLPFPLTVAVLPGLPYTKEAAAAVKKSGKELILHQPMEALGGLDPGPGAIRSDMNEDEIRRVIRHNLSETDGALGMNNHMGSKATSDVRIMTAVLDEAARAGVYFLDSFTVSDSVVHSVASLMRQTTWERSVFLDNTPDRDSIEHYINEGASIAEKKGYAIMIGHVWSAELAQTLSDIYPDLVARGFTISTIAKVMMADTHENTWD